MTITKILEATLVAGQSVVTFTDAEIPNSILRVYPSDSELIYESISLTSNTLTVVYPVQASNKSIALEIIKAGLEVIDSLTSTDANNALSAKQGKALNDAIVLVSGNLDTLTETVNNLDIPENITDLSDVNVISIEDGQVLAWNEDTSKFINVNQSGGSGVINYSETEQDTGTKWLNGETVYQKTINFGALPNTTTKNVDHNISNLSKVLDIKGTSSDGSNVLPIPYINTNQLSSSVQIIVTSTQVSIRTGANLSSYSDTYITLKYIKTS